MIKLLLDGGMVFAPVLGYIPQYNLIRETKNIGSFSVDVCAILLISNIIRIYFWFAHGYALALFLQSILMIGAQLLLLKACVEAINYSNQQVESDIKELVTMPGSEEFSLFDFWRWSRYRHYIMFLMGFTLSLGILTWGFTRSNDQYFGQILGFISMSIEATLGLPQLYKNQSTKSVAGLSFILILTWFGGDFFKTIYYILQQQPVQFIMCGTVQLTVDILIILQFVVYRRNIDVEVKSDERIGA